MTYNPATARLDIPARILKLPIDERGYPVPKFVSWIKGKPDFRIVDPSYLMRAVRHKLCWICGDKLGRYMAFVLGPMCSVNRINSEPPCHLDCARFAVRVCPFMVQPKRIRNERDLPDGAIDPAGFAITRNPGAMAIWVTESYRTFEANMGERGMLFAVGDPVRVEWYARGRSATRDEVMQSINSGFPILAEMAEKDGPSGVAALEKQREKALSLLPAA